MTIIEEMRCMSEKIKHWFNFIEVDSKNDIKNRNAQDDRDKLQRKTPQT